ncbi:LlaJI family restriction endonuclease [Nostoc sp. CHAB 5836]|uniref:LlaJI family restriction endonuclease n=1 Tax=Nostoc sp. CHAB 5836 TaxID=2780404 RepID=UPI001E4A710B|nr:LlaJI family restriction endonuclease [Nostoc sp. CHAB 5836]MCC5618575.1 LlaJI family restriction endonuclease [Nostoc sp. CHAB 5836]
MGIRKCASGNSFEFCLPNGFDNFPDGDFNEVKDLFFKMYRTFRKFECDNTLTKRFKINEPKYQREQDQTTLSAGGISMQTQEGEPCMLYSKLRMIERVLEAYDDLAINSIQKKIRRSEDIDYSQIHKYLERAIYLEKDVIYIEAMDLPRPTVRYESTDLVNLYCYILDEIVQQLDGDVPENIQVRIQDIRFLSQHFQDDYLNSNQSIFDKDTFIETSNILKEALDNIDKNTYYKDTDYWQLYEAIETFLYGEINPELNDGEYWGIQSFSLIWEDMCNTYFFKENYSICFADTDIPIKDYQNPAREGEEQKRVGNYPRQVDRQKENKYGNKWIYRTLSNISYPQKEGSFFGWNQLLCIEFNPRPGTLVYSNPNSKYNDVYKRDRSTKEVLRRFPCPDLVLKNDSENEIELRIVDYKDVPIDFYYKNFKLPLDKADNKYRNDIIKQLTYELALQQTHKVSINIFFIPYYYKNFGSLGEVESDLNIKGIKVFKANFMFIQEIYLNEKL